MKNLILLLMLIASSTAIAHDCRLEHKLRGVFFYNCPVGSYAQAAEASHYDPRYQPVTRVRCYEPVIVCGDEDLFLDEKNPEENLEDMPFPSFI